MILIWTGSMKQKLCAKAKLSIFRSVFVPNLTYGHECWVTIKKSEIPSTGSENGLEKSEVIFLYLTKVKALTFVNLSRSNRCYTV